MSLINFFHIHNRPLHPQSREVVREKTDTHSTDKEAEVEEEGALLKVKTAIKPRCKPRAPTSQP